MKRKETADFTDGGDIFATHRLPQPRKWKQVDNLARFVLYGLFNLDRRNRQLL